jgi:hypothetical protein
MLKSQYRIVQDQPFNVVFRKSTFKYRNIILFFHLTFVEDGYYLKIKF